MGVGLKRIVLGAFLSLVSARAAFAVVIAPGGYTNALPGTTLAARPELKGTVIEDRLAPFSLAVPALGKTITGKLQSRVVRETASGTIDLYWRIIPDLPASLSLVYLTITPGTGAAVDVSYRIDGLGVMKPLRFINGSAGGMPGDLAWYFQPQTAFNGGPPTPNGSTNFVLLHTAGHTYHPSATAAVGAEGQASGGGPVYFAAQSLPTFAPGP